MHSPNLISINDAATSVGLHHTAIRRAIARGELPASKLCSRIRISETDLRAWIEAHRVKPGMAHGVSEQGAI